MLFLYEILICAEFLTKNTNVWCGFQIDSHKNLLGLKLSDNSVLLGDHFKNQSIL